MATQATLAMRLATRFVYMVQLDQYRYFMHDLLTLHAILHDYLNSKDWLDQCMLWHANYECECKCCASPQ